MPCLSALELGMATRPKRPRDPFQLAKLIGDISVGEAMEAGVSDHVWSLEEIAKLAD